MKVIIGLGNPGQQFENTRHNLGFMVIDNLVNSLSISEMKRSREANIFFAETANGEKVALVQPLLYMNLSGEAVKPILEALEASTDDVLVVHDEMDLPFGKIKYRASKGTSGQKGLQSLDKAIGNGYSRVSVGIGKNPEGMMKVDFVLGAFTEEETEALNEKIITEAIDLITKKMNL